MSDTNTDYDIAEASYRTLKALDVQPFHVLCLKPRRTSCCRCNNELTSTVVRIVPITTQEDDNNDDGVGILWLHPLLYECLIRSYALLQKKEHQSTTITKDQEGADGKQAQDDDDNNNYNIGILPSTTPFLGFENEIEDNVVHYGWMVEPVQQQDVVLSTTTTRLSLSISLHYIYNADNNKDSLRSNNNNNMMQQQQEQKYFSRALEGRFISNDTVLVLGSGDSNGGGGGGTVCAVKIEQDEEQEDFSTTTTVYQLGTDSTFHVNLVDISSSASSPITASTTTRRMGPSKALDETFSSNNFHHVSFGGDYCCVGYMDLFQELYTLFRIRGSSAAPSGVLLTGCAGVGKSRMASSLAHSLSSLGVMVRSVSVHDVLLQASWATESDLMNLLIPPSWLFFDTKTTKMQDKLLILDDLHLMEHIMEEEQDDFELLLTRNVIVQAMDRLLLLVSQQKQNCYCGILGISHDNTRASLPTELTCSGRLEKQVCMLPPTQWQRQEILMDLLLEVIKDDDTDEQHRKSQNDDDDENTKKLKRWATALGPMTCGCVAADLRRMCADAWTRSWAAAAAASSLSWDDDDDNDLAMILKDESKLVVAGRAVLSPTLTWEALREAAQQCVPSQLSQLDVIKTTFLPNELMDSNNKGNFYRIHEWSWRDFGGYSQVKKRLYRTVVAPWRRHISSSTMNSSLGVASETSATEDAQCLEIPPPCGVLFHGPPGTGKTLAASCLASSLGLHVVKVRASHVLDQWLGGSEAAVRSLFARARAAAPCILFFDEIDALATNRETDGDDTVDVMSRLLSTFLNEMDGIGGGSGGDGVLVVAATNRFETLDAALLRPGRLEEHVLLSLPTLSDIHDILGIHLSRMPLSKNIQLKEIASALVELNASGAGVEGFCRGLCLAAIRRGVGSSSNPCISQADVDEAIRIWKI